MILLKILKKFKKRKIDKGPTLHQNYIGKKFKMRVAPKTRLTKYKIGRFL